MSDDEKISDILLQWEEARERGEDPDAEILCADCPELTEAVRKRISALRRMDWMTSPSSADVPDPKVGTTLAGRYRIGELVGEGGHGKVYRGFDPELQRPVAIKLPNDRRLNTSDLLEEARKVARLRHPGIVTVYDVGQHNGESFIVSDFVSGTTLCEAGPFTPQQAAALVAKIAESLHAAHEQGFVHRDIKPANILIDEQGRPLLTDFGIATALHDVQPQVTGTLPYMAPEQLGDDPANGDPRTDIWSLGVVLYEILTGKLPFDDPSPASLCEQIRNHVPLPPRGINSGIPSALEAVALKCLAKAPEERYETAQQLAHALGTIRQQSSFLKGAMLSVVMFVPLAVFGASSWFSNSQSATLTESSVASESAGGHIKGAIFTENATSQLPAPVFSLTFDDDAVSPAEFAANGIRLVDGVVGKAAEFDGQSSIQLDCSLPAGASPRTLSAWVKSQSPSVERNSHAIVCGATVGDNHKWGICHLQDRWNTYGWGGQYTSNAVVDNEWHHHCLTYNGETLVYLVDGFAVAIIDRKFNSTSGPLLLGTYSTGSTYFAFTGLIDEVAVYDTALTVQQISRISQSEHAGKALSATKVNDHFVEPSPD